MNLSVPPIILTLASCVFMLWVGQRPYEKRPALIASIISLLTAISWGGQTLIWAGHNTWFEPLTICFGIVAICWLILVVDLFQEFRRSKD